MPLLKRSQQDGRLAGNLVLGLCELLVLVLLIVSFSVHIKRGERREALVIEHARSEHREATELERQECWPDEWGADAFNAGWLGAFGAVVAAVFLWLGRREQHRSKLEERKPSVSKLREMILLAVWVLGPPLWLYWDFRLFGEHVPERVIQKIEHYHELERNMWLAVLLVLGSIYKGAPVTGQDD